MTEIYIAGDGWAMGMDKVITVCTTCDEEYDLPDGMEKCPICGEKL
jgi:predicted RNA-binding Zn-ribbon protein involved in translation (DUF1610 family)